MNIFNYFFDSCKKFRDETALVLNGHERYTYGDLLSFSSGIAAIIRSLNSKNEFAGVIVSRGLSAYAGILGILCSGKGYVPLNPKFPAARNRTIMDLGGIDTLVLGKEDVEYAEKLLEGIDRPLNLILLGESDKLKDNKYIRVFRAEQKQEPNSVPDGAFAYLFFTSGSTGNPKGIPVLHSSVYAYVDYTLQRYSPRKDDRFSQTFDLTFDLSVHDLFVCWGAGAALFVLPAGSLMAPAKFIKEHRLTFWFSVPSVGLLMDRFRMLEPGTFPELKVSLFCGEPLPEIVAAAWQNAAPNSIVENIYGPTEATIGISNYRWIASGPGANRIKNGIVSIGKIFSTQQYRVEPIPGSGPHEGELLLSGSQVASMYWNEPEKTKEQFIILPDMPGATWYRTGDLVETDEDGFLHFRSRIDLQVKIRGHRIETEEINQVIRKFTHEQLVASIPYPVLDGIAHDIYTFLPESCKYPEAEILKYAATLLPDYMVPRRIIFIAELPLNVNGKIDRKKLEGFITTIPKK